MSIRKIFFGFFIYTVFLNACAQQESIPINESNVYDLREAFKKSNDNLDRYINVFPSNYTSFNATFGFDDNKGPAPLYEEAEDYIEKFFSNKTSIKVIEKMISVGMIGHWEADALGIFQKKAREVVEFETPRFCNVADKHSPMELNQFFNFLIDQKNPYRLPLKLIHANCSSKVSYEAINAMSSYSKNNPSARWENESAQMNVYKPSSENTEKKLLQEYFDVNHFYLNKTKVEKEADLDLNLDGLRDKIVVFSDLLTQGNYEIAILKRVSSKKYILWASNNQIINSSCGAEFNQLVTKGKYFTIEYTGCLDGERVFFYDTFKYDASVDDIIVHKITREKLVNTEAGTVERMDCRLNTKIKFSDFIGQCNYPVP